MIQEALRVYTPSTVQNGEKRGKLLNWQGSVRARLTILEVPERLRGPGPPASSSSAKRCACKQAKETLIPER